MKFNYGALKEILSEAKAKAKAIATKTYPINQSRGDEISASVRGDKFGDGLDHSFKNKKELVSMVEQFIKDGADTIYIQGGFDGYERVQDISEGACEPFISEWSVLFWTKEKGICFESSEIEVC